MKFSRFLRDCLLCSSLIYAILICTWINTVRVHIMIYWQITSKHEQRISNMEKQVWNSIIHMTVFISIIVLGYASEEMTNRTSFFTNSDITTDWNIQTETEFLQTTTITVKNPPERYCDLSWFFIQALSWVHRIWHGVYFKNQSKRTFIHLLDHFGAV